MDRFTRPSHWATNAHITDIKQNSTQWNKDREKCIAGIAKASEVFNVLGKLWLRVPPNKRVRTVHHMQELVLHRQVPTAGGELKDMMQKGDFDTIWLLLEESERKRHLLAGIEGTCGRAFLGNIVAGQIFIDFLTAYDEGKHASDPQWPFLFPDEWWEHAVDNCCFVTDAVLSVIDNIVNGSKEMDPVLNLVKRDTVNARGMAKTFTTLRDKPLTHCENCGKSPEDFGRDTRFMVCSTCKSKLHFSIHYCSQEVPECFTRQCQKEDWKKHNQHCGKTVHTNALRGTAGDSLWQFPEIPDIMNDLVPDSDGYYDIATIGVKANGEYERSPVLLRQITLIEADKKADYFLFDSRGRATKLMFRVLRGSAMSKADKEGREPTAEYMVKHMSGEPGFSRTHIVRQLSEEFGDNTEEKLEAFERRSAMSGTELTFIESMSRGLNAVGPRLDSKYFKA
ncbi:hypothetical protein BKA93DRAFT_817295 [Sparassis latifolia]